MTEFEDYSEYIVRVHYTWTGRWDEVEALADVPVYAESPSHARRCAEDEVKACHDLDKPIQIVDND